LAFLPDSRYVITAGADSTIRKWEIVAASQRIGDGEFMAGRATVQLNDSVTRAGMVGPYGVQLWDLGRGAAFVEAPGQAGLPVIAVASQGDRVATLNGYAQVEEFSRADPLGSMVWDAPLRDSAVTRAEQGRLYDGSSLLQYVGRGDTLVLAANGPSGHGTDSSGIVLLSRDSRRGVVLSRYSHAIQSLSVDSSGRLAVVGLADGPVHLRSLRGDTTEIELGKHSGGTTAVLFGAGGAVASGGKLGDVNLFIPRHSSVPNAGGTYGPAVKLGTHERGIARLAFNKTGTVLASGDEGGTIRLWNTTGRRELCSLEGEHADFIRAIAFAPSGRTVATADERGVALWFVDATTSSCRLGYRLADLESPTEAMRFTPNGSALVVVGRDGITRRYLKPVWAPRDSLLVWAAQRLRGRTLSAAERSRYASPR
jgi:WD40 repeat protein